MKKFSSTIKIVTVAFSLMLVVSGCGKKDKKKTEEVSVTDDVIEFCNEELPVIEADRDAALDIYNQYFNTDNMNLDTYVSDLETNAIPKFESYITSLEAIEVETEEVTSLKDIYIQSANKQLEAMQNVVKAIKEEDSEYLTAADTCIQESDAFLQQFETQLTALAAENNITINGSLFGDATASDAATTSATTETTTAE